MWLIVLLFLPAAIFGTGLDISGAMDPLYYYQGNGALLPGADGEDLQQLMLDNSAAVESQPRAINAEPKDVEHLQHSSLWGHQYIAGGAGEGQQFLSPNGGFRNKEQIKTDAVLPAYCEPPNPCPPGYTAEDGCLESFDNTADFSRDYQDKQQCMCDEEHMFTCSPNHQKVSDLNTDITNDMETAIALERLLDKANIENQHKGLVAKKFHAKKRKDPSATVDNNPYLDGQKLAHIVAKKG